ncbi:MAG: DUF4173 domain-containing protein [Sphingobacteriales bacterium]|nr:MAG: DUF4173 domain-containing protein [Sphingobacteriales bacterium]
MNTLKAKPLFLFIALCVYNYLFWSQNIGINLPIFSIIILLANFYFYPEARRSKPALMTAFGTLFTAVIVAWQNTNMSICMHFISFFISVGFIHAESLKTIPYSVWQTFQTYLFIPVTFVEGLRQSEGQYKKLHLLVRFGKRVLIPLTMFIVFYAIYSNANLVFARFSNIFWNKVFDFFNLLFIDFSFLHFMFLLLGVMLITASVFRRTFSNILSTEKSKTDNLYRIKTVKSNNVPQFFGYIMGLKSEYRTATWLLVMVNLLLLVVNCIDITWVWFGFNYSIDFNYKQSVHDGTYLLIFSILLSTAILLFFFRGNLNFYKNNKALRQLAYIWIVQNMILTVSVAIRTWHYISFHGLAYKRLGVLIFLSLTVWGLITLYIKIQKTKSVYFLWRTNTWATYTVLILASAIHWDIFIAKHNLSHKNESAIADFYLEISDHTLPLLYENLDVIEGQIKKYNMPNYNNTAVTSITDFTSRLNNKKDAYLRKHKTDGWQSWNKSDFETLQYLNAHPTPKP